MGEASSVLASVTPQWLWVNLNLLSTKLQKLFYFFIDCLRCWLNFSSQNPGTDLEDNYLQFFKLNLEQFRSHLKDDKMKKQLIKVQFRLRVVSDFARETRRTRDAREPSWYFRWVSRDSCIFPALLSFAEIIDDEFPLSGGKFIDNANRSLNFKWLNSRLRKEVVRTQATTTLRV